MMHSAKLFDFHSHILPNVDHGSGSIECSAELLKKAYEAGIGTVVATPHFYMDKQKPEDFEKIRREAFESLRGLTDSPEIILGAEVAILPKIERLEGLEKLCIGNTDCILLEMPDGIWNDWVFESIFEIQARAKLQPIIAHIDRYGRNPVGRLLEMNVMTQVNAEGILRLGTRGYLKKLLREKKAHVLGSDTHGNPDDYRAYRKAMKILGPLGDYITQTSEQILSRK